MQLSILGLFALALVVGTGCADDPQQPMAWTKPGASISERDAATYECERDTRMVAPTFSRGVLIPAMEAQDFYARCMNAKGFYLSTAFPAGSRPSWDATGKVYPPEAMVLCVLPDRPGSSTITAKACLDSKGTIAGPG